MPDRFALVTTNHADYLCANARASLTAAAARWGADYVELRVVEGSGAFASFERSLFLARPQPWDRVCVVDGDVLIHVSAPSVLAVAEDQTLFYGVLDLHPNRRYDPDDQTAYRADIQERWLRHVHGQFALDVNVPAALARFVNGGFFVATTEAHAAVFRLFRELYDRSAPDDRSQGHYEQALLNYCLVATRTPVGLLSETWNTLDPPLGDRMEAYVYHFTGAGGRAQKARLPNFDWKSGTPSG